MTTERWLSGEPQALSVDYLYLSKQEIWQHSHPWWAHKGRMCRSGWGRMSRPTIEIQILRRRLVVEHGSDSVVVVLNSVALNLSVVVIEIQGCGLLRLLTLVHFFISILHFSDCRFFGFWLLCRICQLLYVRVYTVHIHLGGSLIE